ncbi:cobalt transporter CbiM [Romeria aff. gracilis LEGE 07310]|uniref:Cobalt transporter CbiM n=1 Tax=Vasconcelosia minhoensis LEGE 07310 TaxID=915328 RepID=A0A8J7B057_9CYAN|nr:cobalt transporter CbiM [Romeria gracilis]MBE9079707.1 cobalt transporter CbiM [Romeria aff. gracilis LEGE 07310]
MHIPDGFVSPGVSIAGYAVTAGATWYALRRIDKDRNPQAKIPKAALMTAAFFVVNLIHIPIPPSSIHLVLNGLMGAILGFYALPAIVIALFFQAIIFQHGGITTLGINAVIMGLPALLAYGIFELRHRFNFDEQTRTKLFGFLSGASGVMVSAALFSGIVIAAIPADISAQTERRATLFALALYTIPAVVEGIATLMVASFLDRVKPELLESHY